MLTLPIASFLSAVLSLLPLPHSWQARNVPVLSLATWLFVLNLCQGVNSIIWLSNYETEGTLWCDISTKLNIGAMSAIPASVFCISKYLELVSSQRASKLLPVSGWRSKFLDMFLCLCLPIVLMALHFVVQERRYDIIENIGCVPATFNAIPSILVVYLVPFLLIFGTFIYAAIAFHHFLRHRATFGTHIRCLDSTLTTASYFRLYVTSITFVGILVASTVLSLITMLSSPMHQRTHWSHVDLNLWSIMTYSVDDLPKATIRMLYALWWVVPTLGYLLSLFLSFGQENIALYQKALDLLRTKFTRRPLSEKDSSPQHIVIHKLSTVDVRTDSFRGNMRRYMPTTDYPVYTPTSSNALSVTSSEVTLAMSNASLAGVPAFEPDEKMKTKILALKSMSTINGSSSTCCVHDIENQISPVSHSMETGMHERIIISEEYPASTPPTPSVPSDPGRPSSPVHSSSTHSLEHSSGKPISHPSIAALSTSQRAQTPQSPPYYKPFCGPTIIPNRRALANSNDMASPGEAMEGVYVTVQKEFRADGDEF